MIVDTSLIDQLTQIGIRERRFLNKSPISQHNKLNRKVKNVKEYIKLDSSDTWSFINAGWRVRSSMMYVVPN